MILQDEIKEKILDKGTPYFTNQELKMFIKEIEKKYNSPIAHFKSLTQEGDIVQLEFSFLTSKAIYDFTLKDSIAMCYVFFLKDIISVNEDITLNGKSLKVSNGGPTALYYKAFNNQDQKNLDVYCNSIINEINKL